MQKFTLNPNDMVVRLTGELERSASERAILDDRGEEYMDAKYGEVDIVIAGVPTQIEAMLARLNGGYDGCVDTEELVNPSQPIRLDESLKPLARRVLHDITGEDEDGNSPIEETKLRLMVCEKNADRFKVVMEYLVKTGRVIRTFGAKYGTPFYRLAI